MKSFVFTAFIRIPLGAKSDNSSPTYSIALKSNIVNVLSGLPLLFMEVKYIIASEISNDSESYKDNRSKLK